MANDTKSTASTARDPASIAPATPKLASCDSTDCASHELAMVEPCAMAFPPIECMLSDEPLGNDGARRCENCRSEIRPDAGRA